MPELLGLPDPWRRVVANLGWLPFDGGRGLLGAPLDALTMYRLTPRTFLLLGCLPELMGNWPSCWHELLPKFAMVHQRCCQDSPRAELLPGLPISRNTTKEA